MSITNLSRNGLRDWFIQRITSVILGSYFVFIMIYLICNPQPDFLNWNELFSCSWMRIFTLLALLSFICHAWIGIWTVSTDYLTMRILGKKSLYIRLLFQGFCALLLFVYLIWGIQIIWGL